MLTLKLISEETERVVKGLEKKCFPNAREAVEKVLEYDRLRRESQQQLDANKQRQNQLSREIGGLMKSGKRDEANQVKEQVAQLKAADKALQEVMQKAQADMNEVLLTIPNIPTDEVPEGRDASSNVVVKEGGVKPDLPEGSLCHWDLLKKFNLVDFDLGVKITGAGFPSTSARWPVSSARWRLSSSTRPASRVIPRCSRPSWSMRPADWARASSPTRRARCTMPTSTTST